MTPLAWALACPKLIEALCASPLETGRTLAHWAKMSPDFNKLERKKQRTSGAVHSPSVNTFVLVGFASTLCHYCWPTRRINALKLTMLLRLPAIFSVLTLLAACAGSPSQVDSNALKASAAEAETAVVELPERAIPENALYGLLLAEFALRRKAYDVALEQYMTLSSDLRDSGISAHTTHLSQFLRRDEEALEASTLWVELEPDSAEANQTRASLLIRKGRNLEALPHLAIAQRNGKPAHFPALLNGFRQLDSEQRSALLTGIDELAEEFPDNTKLLLTQALARADLKQFPEALATLQRLFELEPQQIQALVLEAKILAEQEKPKPFARIARVLKENPDNTQVRLQYARLLTTSDMVAAKQQFEILSEQSPRDGDLLFSLALINRETGDQEAAAVYLEQILALGQRVDEANYYLGRIGEDAGEPAKAITHYMRVEDSNQFMPANNRIGNLLLEQGELQRSASWFAEQRERNPGRAEELYTLEADLLTSAGIPGDALVLLNEGLQAYPDSSSLRYARAMLRETQDDLTGVEQDLRAIIDADADNTTALNALGYILANRTDRLTEALQLVSRALELQPGEPAIMDSMGWVLFRTGRHEEAIDYLTRAYASFPDAEVAAHLGEVLWATGKTEAALAIWHTAALKSPQHKILRETLERLGVELPNLPASADTRSPQQP